MIMAASSSSSMSIVARLLFHSLLIVNYLPQKAHSFSTLKSFSTLSNLSNLSSRTRGLRPSSSSSRLLLSKMSASAPPKVPKNIVVIGGGIQGTSVAYFLSKHLANTAQNNDSSSSPSSSSSKTIPTKIKILEAKEIAAAASGKGGGFMARSWGDGSPTQSLHHLGFDLYRQLASVDELNLDSYRCIPVLSVSPGTNRRGYERAKNDGKVGEFMPNWLDGDIGRVGLMGRGDDTAQVTPREVVEKMIASDVCSGNGLVEVVLGECVGIDATNISESDDNGDDGDGDNDEEVNKQVKGVRYIPRGETEEQFLEADVVVVSAGPWSCKAEDWFGNSINLPMEGVKSTSIVWKRPTNANTHKNGGGGDGDSDGEIENDEFVVDGTALFCGEDNRFGTHLEVYPRPDGSIYICGIGGSDYIPSDELKNGAYREECNAKESRVDAASNAFMTMSSTYRAKGTLEKVQACMRPCPPDAMPYMGKIPGYEGAYVNAGHNCWGIAWAPSCGLAMTELILDGESKSVDLRYFDPSRFTTRVGGGRGRKRRGQSVGEQW